MEDEEVHRHRWILGGSPGSDMNRGKCRCGAVRTFDGGAPKGGMGRWRSRRDAEAEVVGEQRPA